MLDVAALALAGAALFTAGAACALALGAHRRISSWRRRVARRRTTARVAGYGEAT